ncbi:MAG: hypothetical protein AB9869_10345 [Verrucomicrobiia bacterium]
MNNPFPTTRSSVLAFSGGLTFACVMFLIGYYPFSGSAWILRCDETPPLEYFLAPQSFSDVDNTRRLLEAVADQSLSELRQRSVALHLRTGAKVETPEDLVELERILQDLRKGIEAFGSTGQEHGFRNDLLVLLKRHELYDSWLDTYLDLLYRHPTHPSIGRFAQDAIHVSAKAGHRSELAAAYLHLAQIPLEFEVKKSIAVLLADLKGTQLTQTPNQ